MKPSAIIFRYLLLAALVAILPIVANYTGYSGYLIPHFWLFYGYISAMTLMVIILVSVVHQNNPDISAQAFLIGTTVKILGCLFFILIFLRKTPVNKLVFALDFCYVYFLNIAFEVYYLLRNLRNQNLR